jgi:predicted ATPase
MLKQLTIKNFKSIQDMTIEFTSLTVLIGENSCGKSTVLQALDFLRSAATRDIPEYLREKGWSFEELKSKFNNGVDKPVEFISEYRFVIDGNIRTLRWNIAVDLYRAVDWRIDETIENSDNIVLLRHGRSEKAIPESFKGFYFQSSLLKYYNPAEDEKELIRLKEFLSSSAYYGVLSPDTIRLGEKTGVIGNIGNHGEWLSAFIYHIGEEGGKTLSKRVSEIMGIEIEIQAMDAGSAFMLITKELHNMKELRVDSWHVSDGLLRIIAFVAITLQRLLLRYGASDGAIQIKADGTYNHRSYVECTRGMILLDEIENGINPYLTERVVGLFRNVVAETSRQVIVTTHSPVLLNDFKPEEVVFLWKNRNGRVHCKHLFSTEEMRESLDFLNPGEVWENYGKDAILHKLGVFPKD